MKQEIPFPIATSSGLTPKIIDQTYQNSKKNGTTHELLCNIFHTLKLSHEETFNPGRNSREIAHNISSMSSNNKSQIKKPLIDPQAVYPLNKNGSFGTLLRECTIVEKGLEEKEGNKASVLKEIVGFKNRIETDKNKNNEKLEWIKESKEYPFRLILKDNKNSLKAIYFKTKKEAENVRIYYVNKFLYKGNISSIIRQSNKKLSLECIEQFKLKLLLCSNELKSKNSKREPEKYMKNIGSSYLDPLNSSITQGKSSFHHKEQRESVIDDILNTSSVNEAENNGQGYDTNAVKLLIEKDESRILEKSYAKSIKDSFALDHGLFKKLAKAYIKNMFEAWAEKSHENEEKEREIDDEEESIKGVNLFDSKAKRNESYTNLKYTEKNNNTPQIRVQHTPSILSNPSAPPSSKFLTQSNLTHQSHLSPLVPFSSAHPSSKNNFSLTYKSIEFFKQTNIFIKPIIIITLLKNNTIEEETKFNTMIMKKDPHLCYELVPNNGTQTHTFKTSPEEYELNIKSIDFLSNSELCNSRISLKEKVLSPNSLLMNSEKSIRIEIVYENFKEKGKSNDHDENPEGSFLEINNISPKTIEDIRNFWEKESVKKNYYNISKDIKILEILEFCELPPKSWMLGLSPSTYKIVTLLHSSSHILKFKLCESILPVIQTLQRLYPEVEELIEVTLSILTQYMKPYFYPNFFNKTNKLHEIIGINGDIDLSSKIELELEVIKQIVQIECPEFYHKSNRRAIAYVHLLYEYIYEIFSNNFKFKVLVEIWNFLFKDINMIPVYLILFAVWLIKFYQTQLLKCYKHTEIVTILQSKDTPQSDVIIKEIIALKQKFFTSSSINIIDSLKGMFHVKPLEKVLNKFYENETEKIDKRRTNKTSEKNQILHKLSQELPIELPKYKQKSYCFHIYFYSIPKDQGSLYIKSNNIEYECLNIPKVRYFIIGEISSTIKLEFINSKSEEFSCELKCIQGINRFNVQLKNEKNKNDYQVEYICGLLTEGHIDALKRNKKFEHYIGAFAKQEEVFDEFLRPVEDCSFLNSYGKRLGDLGRKIKVGFSSGSQNFDEIEFYLRWICISTITLPEKLKLVRELALNISSEYFLCDNGDLSKKLFLIFLRMSEFHITPLEFKSYYSDSIPSEFKSPRIIKCSVCFNNQQYKIENIANEHLANKIDEYLLEDIVINELLICIQKEVSEINKYTEGFLNIIYSSFGEVKSVEIPIIKRKNETHFVMDDAKYEMESKENNDIFSVEPEILASEVLPTFSKISTILDFVNNSKSLESISKSNENRKIPELINLLKNCDLKYNKVMMLRYSEYPARIKIPFLQYYYQLIWEESEPYIPKNIFLNNLQTDLESICTYSRKLTFSDGKRFEPVILDKELGLHGNLRMLPGKVDSLFFVTVSEDEKEEPNAEMFVNYGFGILRWEPCIVVGFSHTIKGKDKKKVKQYLVRNDKGEKFYRDFQIKIKGKVEEALPNYENKSSQSRIGNIIKTGDASISRRDLETRESEGNKRKLNF